MAICPSCQKKLKWHHFKREICPACSKNWDGMLAQAAAEAPPITEPAPVTEPAPDSDYLDLGSLLESIHVKESVAVDGEIFSNVWAPGGYPTRSFATSLVIHACMVGLIYGVSGMSFGKSLPFTRAALERDYEITYYRPQDLLPKINSKKDGPKAPAGKKPDVKPPKGSTAFHPTQTIQSSPLQADNDTQTIIQPSAPQPLKQEVKVPNIVIWNVPETNVETLQIASKQIAAPMMQKPDAALPQLRPPDAEARDLERKLSELTLAKSDVVNMQAKMTVKMGTSAEWNIASDAANPGPLLNVPVDNTSQLSNLQAKMTAKMGTSAEWSIGDGKNPGPTINVPVSGAGANQLRNMIVLSANPGLPGPGGLKVPAGSKTGAFSMSPDGNRAGSPDGGDDGVLGGGVAGGGGRGGTGSGFGGGGNIASIQIPGMSVKGGPNTGAPTVAGPGRRPRSPGGFSDMQTIDDPGESYNITVVEGRTGGAGLGVYGILSGKRNYTVFIPMPAGRWTMQFSEMPDKASESASMGGRPAATPVSGSQVTVAAGDAIMQPRPLRKVDPGRPEDPELAQLRGLVVLYAVIRKDGGIDRIRVVRSLNPVLDERAIAALKQWKFKAAQLGENPIEVQALFGVPFRPVRQ
jgi:TonB family protein